MIERKELMEGQTILHICSFKKNKLFGFLKTFFFRLKCVKFNHIKTQKYTPFYITTKSLKAYTFGKIITIAKKVTYHNSS